MTSERHYTVYVVYASDWCLCVGYLYLFIYRFSHIVLYVQ